MSPFGDYLLACAESALAGVGVELDEARRFA